MSYYTTPTRTPPRRNQGSAPIPRYDDDPPPYPGDEITTIGWSPKVAIITNNASPNGQLTMPLPMVQYSTMPIPTIQSEIRDGHCPPIEPLPAAYALTRRSLSPTVSSIIVPHMSHVRNEIPASTPDSRTTCSTYPTSATRRRVYDQRRTVLIIFGIIALVGILLVITIAILSRKNIDIYHEELSSSKSRYSHS